MNTQKKNKLNQFVIKLSILFFSLFLTSSELFAESERNNIRSKAIDGGIGLGSIIAVVASWSRNKSILWAIVHGLLGWIYVVYFIFTRED
jgi:high-affinity Fe2+/Pb2+ permease